ncbi:hypothetical protein D1872_275140 [compost metagenome]
MRNFLFAPNVHVDRIETKRVPDFDVGILGQLGESQEVLGQLDVLGRFGYDGPRTAAADGSRHALLNDRNRSKGDLAAQFRHIVGVSRHLP